MDADINVYFVVNSARENFGWHRYLNADTDKQTTLARGAAAVATQGSFFFFMHIIIYSHVVIILGRCNILIIKVMFWLT